MATVGETTRPGYVYDSATDVWIPVGIGPHSHTPAAIGAISSSVVTTKGDLIVATGSGTVVRQGVGADGSYLVADSTQADGVTWAGPSTMAGKNFIINGGMDIWQRGTSFTTTGTFATSYTADRWQGYQGGAGNTQVTSRQASDLPGFRYFARIQRPSGNTSTAYLGYWTTLETANSIPLAGKPVTLSFYARAGSNMTSSNALVATVNSGTGTDQPNYSFTGYTTVVTSTVNLLSSGGIVNGWQRYTLTGTVASNMTEVGVTFAYTPTGTASTNDYYDITGVQLEVGSVATPYAPNGATYQAELAACQRYYQRYIYTGYANSAMGIGSYYTSSDCYVSFPFSTFMRVAPSFNSSAANALVVLSNSASRTSTSITLTQVSNQFAEFRVATSASTSGVAGLVRTNTSSDWLEFSGEL
jgi:hypothetical protein